MTKNIMYKKVDRITINKCKFLTKTLSNELENALKESVIIEKEYKEGKRKSYNNVQDMIKSILDD